MPTTELGRPYRKVAATGGRMWSSIKSEVGGGDAAAAHFLFVSIYL
jgi:hypothetical protein